ncbi:MAG: hypothetical protein O3A48_00170 [Actinomycetota bacterium]|nr:hypothetical protein [Actinomycetota bacterium]MDA3012944.1 hypothetical protein [Actinomycetota bacterium]
MRFSNKVRAVILLIVLMFSGYIGYLLGDTFCKLNLDENCNLTVILNILFTISVGIIGTIVLINLSEKSITEWNQNFEEE